MKRVDFFSGYFVCFLGSAILVSLFRSGEAAGQDVIVFAVIGLLFRGILSYIRDEEMYFFIHQIPAGGKGDPGRILSLLVHASAILIIVLKIL